MNQDELINKIHIDRGNFEFCAANNKINGTLYLGIKKAMDEYAKQECIAFENWRQQNNYHKYANGFYCNRPPTAGVKTWFTVPELYSLYIQNKPQ